MTTHFQPVLRLRLHGAIPPLPHVFMTWCTIENRGNFTFILHFDQRIHSVCTESYEYCEDMFFDPRPVVSTPGSHLAATKIKTIAPN
jgi:hypothetical protein